MSSKPTAKYASLNAFPVLLVGTLVCAATALLPVGVEAQTPETFESLRSVLAAGQPVIVTHDTGRETRGRVAEVSASSLTLEVPTTKENPQGRQIFAEDAVTKVVRRDSVENGTLIGLAIGVAALWGHVRATCGPAGYDPECEGNVTAVDLLPLVGTGAAVGALIDMAITKTVYRSGLRSTRSSLVVSPRLGLSTAGLALSLRF